MDQNTRIKRTRNKEHRALGSLQIWFIRYEWPRTGKALKFPSNLRWKETHPIGSIQVKPTRRSKRIDQECSCVLYGEWCFMCVCGARMPLRILRDSYNNRRKFSKERNKPGSAVVLFRLTFCLFIYYYRRTLATFWSSAINNPFE